MPTFPRTGTDTHRLLVAMLTSPDAAVLNPARKFGITQNSRASDLRLEHGWHIESYSVPPVRKGQKRRHGYRLTSVHQIAAGRATLSRQAAA